MNRSHLAAAAALAVLAGCTPMDRGVDAAEPRFPRIAVVNVVNGAVSVTEEPVDLFANNGAIRWGFGSNPAGYVFPTDGIKFDRSPPTPPSSLGCRSFPDPDTVFKNCKPMQRGEFFQCVKTGPTRR